MTMWHNISLNCNAHKTTRKMDRDAICKVIDEAAAEIKRRLIQNQEELYGGVRVRLLLERIDT